MRIVRALTAALGVPALLASACLAMPAGSGQEAGIRLGAFLVLGLTGLAIVAGRLDLARIAFEAVAILAAVVGAALLGGASGLTPDTSRKAAAITGLGLTVPWAWSLPLRGVALRGVARVVLLGSAAAMLATPWLIPSPLSDLPAGSFPSPYGRVPEWVVNWNPLARLHGGLLGQDWFHGPVLYPRVGERPYDYPAWDKGLLAPAASAVAALALAILVVFGRQRIASAAGRASAGPDFGRATGRTMLGGRDEAVAEGQGARG